MTRTETVPQRGGLMRVARSRGMLSGLLLMLLGIWGALIPFIGPYFHYAYTPDSAWTWTSGRLWLEVLPGAAAFVAGFLLTTTAHRAVGVFAGWLGSVAGAWFVLGPTFSRLWHGAGDTGSPVGGTTRQVLEQIGFFSGLGVVILFLAAQALGRFTVRSLRDVRAAETYATRTVEPAAAPTATAAPVAPRRTLFGGNRAVQTDEAAPAGRTDTMVQPAARGTGAHTERVETRRDA